MPKILIIDANEDNRVLFQKILTSAGHKVITAPDGLRGISRFRKDLPDLVITDLKMPVMDGIEFIREIRTHKVNSHAPIILSSATYRDVAGRIRSLKTDGIDYLQLPFDTDNLLLKVNLLLANKKTLDNLIALKESLGKKKDFLKSVLDSMCDAVVIIDAKKSTVIGANRAFLDLVGCTEETIKGQKCHHLAKQYDIACCISAGDGPLAVTIKTGKYASVEQMHCPGNSGRRYYEISTSPVKNEKGELIQVVHVTKDITERKRMEEQLQTAAITDDLTGLLNRRGFYTFSGKQSKLANRSKNQMCLIYLDLNNLKAINDILGHHAGDQALVDIANILKQTFRQSDIISRMGGDEFAVLLAEPSNYGVGNVVARHINKHLSALNKKTDRGYQLSLSIGTAYFDPEHPCSVDDLITRADTEMYKNKKRHKLKKLSVQTLDGEESDKRTYARFNTDGRFWAEIEDEGKVATKNLSISGICLKTRKQLNVNGFINIKIRSPKKECEQKSLIVWSHPSGTNTIKRTTDYESGLKFISSDIKSINLLKDFISGLFA